MITKGSKVRLNWTGLDLTGTVEEVLEDGGYSVKCGDALWVHLPAGTTALTEIET